MAAVICGLLLEAGQDVTYRGGERKTVKRVPPADASRLTKRASITVIDADADDGRSMLTSYQRMFGHDSPEALEQAIQKMAKRITRETKVEGGAE